MIKRLFAAAMFAALTACATAPAPADPPSFDSRAGVAIQEVTLARKAATTLAQAGKITWAQDDATQAALTLIRAQIRTAQGLSITDPAQAAKLLADALNALAAYQGASK